VIVADELSDLERARRHKLEQLRARGIDPYPNDFRPTHTAARIIEWYGALDAAALEHCQDTVAVAGRMLTRRDFGKASFFHLLDRSGTIQVYVRRDLVGDDAFEVFKLTDLGDFLGIVGRPFRTRTNELTIEARQLRLLAKALRPLPEKWHGLTDVEARYRQRYLDLIANPQSRQVFLLRSRLVERVRAFFNAREFIEVETPMMHPIPGGAAARPFVTHHNALDIDLYLRIAPELYLKRLLVGGFERVYEINRNFRNEGISVRHNPEFTMLEFYWAYATYEDLMVLTEELFVTLADELKGSRVLPYGEWSLDFTPPFRRISIPQYLAERAGVPVDSVFALEIRTIREVAQRLGVPIEKDYEGHYGPAAAGHMLVDVFEAAALPDLIQPTFVYHYPASVSPLARRNATHPAFVDRFELYCAQREICNAFSELNDPLDQRARFEEQLRARAAGDEEAHAMDEDFLRALEHGMPPAAGEGIGIDRLVMLFTNSASIRDVILFPQMRPE
jgi:lysyl-tRNA synthetase class 2